MKAEGKRAGGRCAIGGKSGRGGRIRTDDLYVPNVALYQAKLHPEGDTQRGRSPRQRRKGGVNARGRGGASVKARDAALGKSKMAGEMEDGKWKMEEKKRKEGESRGAMGIAKRGDSVLIKRPR